LDQDNRTFHPNPGYQVLNPGEARGTIIGGSLRALHLLQGTPYMPSLENSILFLERMATSTSTNVEEFDRYLQSVIHAPEFLKVRGLVIGRFENSFGMTPEKLAYVFSKPPLQSIPIIANADFGHTMPIFTFPIGGTCHLQAESSGNAKLVIGKH
jgi:muramoyltetrapeptide carboxypeptidase